MGQRSPMNARYQKHTKPEGKTRKSAASAKPKRSGAAPAAKSTSKSSRERVTLPPLPDNIKIWRYVWWGMLGGAIVFSLLAFQLRTLAPWNTITLVVAYVLIFGGLAIDFLKVRPARQAQMAAYKQGKSGGKSDKADKPKGDAKAKPDASDSADAGGDAASENDN